MASELVPQVHFVFIDMPYRGGASHATYVHATKNNSSLIREGRSTNRPAFLIVHFQLTGVLMSALSREMSESPSGTFK